MVEIQWRIQLIQHSLFNAAESIPVVDRVDADFEVLGYPL